MPPLYDYAGYLSGYDNNMILWLTMETKTKKKFIFAKYSIMDICLVSGIRRIKMGCVLLILGKEDNGWEVQNLLLRRGVVSDSR